MILLVLFSVSFKKRLDWSQKSLKGISVQRSHNQISLGSDSSLSFLVSQKSKLSKIVILFVLINQLIILNLSFQSFCMAFHDKIESLPFFTFIDDNLTSFITILLKTISDLIFFIGVQSLKDFNFVKKIIVFLSV